MEKFPVATEKFEFEEIKTEMEELFDAVMDDLKSEETNTVETSSAVSPGDNESQNPDDDSEFNTAITQLTNDISSLSRCRLCAMPENNMIGMFGFDAKSKNILSKINHCLPIVVNEMDTLPKQVCRSCLEELGRCYRFHQTVAKAEKQLLAFAKVASGNLEETERYCVFLPQCVRQHGPTDETLRRNSDIDMSNNDPLSSPENAEIVDATVKMEVPLSRLSPRSAVLTTTEIRPNNNSAAKTSVKSSSVSGHQNPDSNTKAFDFETTIASGVVQQSSCVSEVKRVTHSSSAVDDMPRKKVKNEVNPPIDEQSSTKEQRYGCTTCLKTLKTKTTLSRHNKTHTVVRELHRCNLCSKVYKIKWHLMRHYKLHTGRGLHICDYCGMKSVSEADGIRHRRTHTGERPFECSICKMRFTRLDNLKVHTARAHSHKRAYPCSMCDKSFKIAHDRTNHMLTHMNKNERRLWQCDRCKRFLKTRSSITKHIRICENFI